MEHLDAKHLVLIVPVAALVFTPLFPFNSELTTFAGLPVVMWWVAAWAVITTALLTWLYRYEKELGAAQAPAPKGEES